MIRRLFLFWRSAEEHLIKVWHFCQNLFFDVTGREVANSFNRQLGPEVTCTIHFLEEFVLVQNFVANIHLKKSLKGLKITSNAEFRN